MPGPAEKFIGLPDAARAIFGVVDPESAVVRPATNETPSTPWVDLDSRRYDEVVGMSWQLQGRGDHIAAAKLLIENGLKQEIETDGR